MSHNDHTPHPVPWSYLRALEVEGRYPNGVGAWAITRQRLEFGEGLPDSDSTYAIVPDATPDLYPSSLPNIPTNCRHPENWSTYHRITSVKEAYETLRLRNGNTIIISVPLSPGWIAPDHGIIDEPRPGDVFYDNTHMVSLVDVIDRVPVFEFLNSWGTEWGDSGIGFLPFPYFEKYVFEAFTLEPIRTTLIESQHTQPVYRNGDPRILHLKRVVTRTALNERFYTLTIESGPRDRRAWALVRERQNWLELEDLYVRPEYRSHGLAKSLVKAVNDIRSVKGMPLRVFVSWAESRLSNPKGFEAMCSLTRQLGCTFRDNDDARSAYLAVEGLDGDEYPKEPDPHPTHPRGPIHDLVVASAMLIASNHAVATDDGLQSVPPPLLAHPEQSAAVRRVFDDLNEERWRLVNKEADGTITTVELIRLEELQTKVRVLADCLVPTDTARLERMKDLIVRHGGEP